MADPLADEVTELRRALDADAADLWRVINAIRDELKARWWITESRGSYAYDDERYRQETRHAFEAITAILDAVQAPASTRFLDVMRRTDRAEVAAVRGAERRPCDNELQWVCDRLDGLAADMRSNVQKPDDRDAGSIWSWRADIWADRIDEIYADVKKLQADPPSLTPPSDQEK